MGDNRSPLWRHGGTVHGPQPRDYSWRFPRKMRRNALRSALAQKLRDGELYCLDSMVLDSHRTADLHRAVGKDLGLGGKTLLVCDQDDRNLDLAARNHPQIKVVRALGVSVVDLVHHDNVVFSEPAIKALSEVLAR